MFLRGIALKSSHYKLPLVREGFGPRWIPTIVGLASIPLIIKPIDHAVDFAMERFYAPYFRMPPLAPALVKAEAAVKPSA